MAPPPHWSTLQQMAVMNETLWLQMGKEIRRH